MTDIFEQNSDDETKVSEDFSKNDEFNEELDYESELVGEGKKYKDHKALAKAAAEKEFFIQRLQRENAEIRKDLETSVTLQKFMDQMKSKESNSQENVRMNEQDNVHNEEQPKSSALTQEDIDTLVARKLQEADDKRRKEINATAVKQALVNTYGSAYASVVDAKAKELGMTRETVNALAQNNPSAFMKLMDITGNPATPSRPSTSSIPTSTVNRGINTDPQVRNKAFYDAIKTKNPSEYWSPKIQNQLHNDAIKLGAAFFQ